MDRRAQTRRSLTVIFNPHLSSFPGISEPDRHRLKKFPESYVLGDIAPARVNMRALRRSMPGNGLHDHSLARHGGGLNRCLPGIPGTSRKNPKKQSSTIVSRNPRLAWKLGVA